MCSAVSNPLQPHGQVPLSMGFFRQEYWSGLPLSSPGDLTNPEMELKSPVSPALLVDLFITTEPPGKPKTMGNYYANPFHLPSLFIVLRLTCSPRGM